MYVKCSCCGKMKDVKTLIFCTDCNTIFCEVCYISHSCEDLVAQILAVIPIPYAHSS